MKKIIIFSIGVLLILSMFLIGCAEEGSDENGALAGAARYMGKMVKLVKICNTYSEPGTYTVKPCDVFVGPLGVNFRIDKLEEYKPSGKKKAIYIRGSYINKEGQLLFKNSFSYANKSEPAYNGLNLLRVGSNEEPIMKLTANPDEIFDLCIKEQMKRIELQLPYSDIANCIDALPTKVAKGEKAVLYEYKGYFGKSNNLEYPQLAECLAKDIYYAISSTSEFFKLPPLEKGYSYMYVFSTITPKVTGDAFGSVSAWNFQKDDKKQIEYTVKNCNEKLQTGKFATGNHEITHLFTLNMNIPGTFNEGLANFDWEKPNGWLGSTCKKNGFQYGKPVIPYIKYYSIYPVDSPNVFQNYISGECFWDKLTYDYGLDIIAKVLNELKKENAGEKSSRIKSADEPGKIKSADELGKVFEKSLESAGVDTCKYQQWGLGENKNCPVEEEKQPEQQSLCGNSNLDGDEECDDPKGDHSGMYSKQCSDLGLGDLGFGYNGYMGCTKDCKLDTSGCYQMICRPDTYYCFDSEGNLADGYKFRKGCNKEGNGYYPEDYNCVSSKVCETWIEDGVGWGTCVWPK